jgi:cytochrome c peroxidase
MDNLNRRSLGTLLLALALLAGCNKEQPAAPAPAAPEAPAAPAPTPAAAPAAPVFDVTAVQQRAKAMFAPLPASMESATNPSTDARTALGRQLYYETRLSKNQDISCNSCHSLTDYGIDVRTPGAKTSIGHKGQLDARNSPTVYNAALHFVQFWDGRAADVEAQAQAPMRDPVEMAMPSDAHIAQMLKSIPGYAPLFAAAFPDDKDPITFANAAKAIGAFERKLVTPGRFDKFLGGDAHALNEQEAKGLAAFMDAGCMACHMGPLLGGTMYQKLGLMKPYPTKDQGRFEETKKESDKFFFKVPSLRNIAKTAPYFHDGSVATLEEAVQLMAEYQTAAGKCSPEELKDVVAFLNSLTGDLPTDYIKPPAALASSKATPKPDPS